MMNFLSEVKEGVKVIVVEGYLDSEQITTFREKFYDETAGDERAILDFSGLEYLDSSGLAALVNIHKTFTARGAKVVLFGLRENILRVVRFTKLDKVFLLADTLAQAQEALR